MQCHAFPPVGHPTTKAPSMFSDIHHIFSPAQCVGYSAMILGIAAFLQQRDNRLKFLNSLQSFTYALHFFLLGNPTALYSAFVAGIRTGLSLKTRSAWAAAAMMVLLLILCVPHVHHAADLLPIVGSAIATIALFFWRGIPMRLGLFTSTICWLTNNYLSGSIGGTLLECFILTSNAITMLRMRQQRPVRITVTQDDVVAASEE